MKSNRLVAFVAPLLALSMVFAACGEEEPEPTTDTGTGAQEHEDDAGLDHSMEEETEEPGGYQVDVLAEDYEFSGIGEILPAGKTTFNFENAGEELHEFVLIKPKGDEKAQELLKMPEKEAMKLVDVEGAAFSKPGESAKKPLVVDLQPGYYFGVCFVPVGTTPENQNAKGPPHFLKGMIAEFTVE